MTVLSWSTVPPKVMGAAEARCQRGDQAVWASEVTRICERRDEGVSTEMNELSMERNTSGSCTLEMLGPRTRTGQDLPGVGGHGDDLLIA